MLSSMDNQETRLIIHPWSSNIGRLKVLTRPCVTNSEHNGINMKRVVWHILMKIYLSHITPFIDPSFVSIYSKHIVCSLSTEIAYCINTICKKPWT